VDDGETAALELFEGHELAGVVGRSAAMRSLMARVQKAAKSDASVLLLGETGTGKEVLARALHRLSPRNDQPFETVDCGSMAPTLIGSELFGHEKGAFTGAHQQHVGAFERAHGGTLFLDEIGELPSALQTALLGALERRSFRRLGGTKPIQVDVRVVCATHRDLRSEVNAGTFRQDLYYRIAVVLLRLIPLRERTEDIAELAEHFMRRAGYSGPVADILPESTLEAMRQHRWPGNVRELRNAVEAALVMGDELDLEPATDGPRPNTESLVDLLDLPYSEAKDILVDRFEGQYVERLLERANGNVTSAARLAGMNRSYLTRVLNRRGLRGRSD
jgi:DNA-binding NtrC family response regulator